MNGLAISRDALSSYLQNILQGRSMRQIATPLGCPPSTVLRRIRRVEDLRDIPEWERVLSALEDHLSTVEDPDFASIDRRTILTALRLTAKQVEREFRDIIAPMSIPDCFLLAGDMPTAAVMLDGEVKGTLPHVVLMASLAFGWLTPLQTGSPRLRRFKLTDAAMECTMGDCLEPTAPNEARVRAAAHISKQSALEVLRKRDNGLVTDDHLHTAKTFQMAYLLRGSCALDTYQALTGHVPPRLLGILEEICGKGTGFEAAEQKLKLPARSAKVLAVAALEVFSHAPRACIAQ